MSDTAADPLTDAAFGRTPQRWPLPAAAGPRTRWLRAVAAGGQGHYAVACTELDALLRATRDPVLHSLAHSTRASFIRQLGGHTAARGWDGRAAAAAGDDPEACADALTGLAADALGVGRFAASARLLDRAADAAAAAGGRAPVRLAWVRAELAMARGDGTAAVAHAEQGVRLAEDFGSARHRVKSQVVLAAAWCAAGELDRARAVADAALPLTERFGLVPLRWALACLLGDIGSDLQVPERVAAIRDHAADTVRQRGGAWSTR